MYPDVTSPPTVTSIISIHSSIFHTCLVLFRVMGACLIVFSSFHRDCRVHSLQIGGPPHANMHYYADRHTQQKYPYFNCTMRNRTLTTKLYPKKTDRDNVLFYIKMCFYEVTMFHAMLLL